MRITEIHIEGFGVFHNVSIRHLSPSLTLFEGQNEAGKTTLMSCIRAILFGFEGRRSGQNRYEPIQGHRHGGALHVVTEDGRQFRIERVEAGGRNRVRVNPLADASHLSSPQEGITHEEELLKHLLYGTSKFLYQNVFAFGISELERLDTLQADEVSAHIYTIGMGTGLTPLGTVLTNLESEQSQLFKPGGKKPVINQLLQQLDATSASIRDLQILPDEFFTLRDRLTVLDREITEYQTQLEEIKQQTNWLECLVKARPDWERLQVIRQELKASPHIQSFPAGGIERLDQLDRSLESLKTRIDETQRAIKKADMRKKELHPDPLLLSHQADIEALEDIHGQAKGQMDALFDLRSRAAFRRKVLDEILSRLGQTWTDDRVACFQASIPIRERIRDLRDRVEVARLETVETSRRQDEVAKIRREKENELERLQQKLEQLDVQDSPERVSLKEREKSLRKWFHIYHRLELTKQHQDDLHRQVTALAHQIQAQQNERTLAKAQQGLPVWVLLIMGLVFTIPATFSGIEQQFLLTIALALAGSVAVGLLTWWRRGFVRQRQARLTNLRFQEQTLKKQIHDLREEQVRTTQEQERLSKEMSDLSRVAVDVDTLEPDQAETALRALEAERRLKERRDDLVSRIQDDEEALVGILEEQDDLGKNHRVSERLYHETQEAWSAFLSELGLPNEITPDGALEVLSGVERAQTQLEEWRDATQELHRVEKQIEQYTQRLKTVLEQCQWNPSLVSDFPSTLATLQKALEESQEAQGEYDRLDQWIQEKHVELESAEAEKARHMNQLKALLDAGGASDTESFRKRAVLYARQSELERQQRQLEVALQTHAGSETRSSHLEQTLSAKSRAELEREFHEATENTQQQLVQTLTQHIQEKGRVEQQIQDLEQNERLSESMLKHQTLLTQLDCQTERWAIRAICRSILEKARQIYERERQPAVLQEASRFFTTMTEGRYVRIMVPLGEMRLEIESADGRARGTEILSRGTAEQLYLAMRLAFVREYAKHAGPLPIVVDDILVNFDSIRAKATMKVLQEIAKTHQVFVFTCHTHISHWFQETAENIDTRTIPQGI